MDKPSSSFAVARYFFEQAQQDGRADSTPMKVLKLAYIAHGWVLCFTDTPLIVESVQAWKYGPVIPSLYHYLKRFGADPVPSSEIELLPPLEISDKVRGVLDAVWESYKNFSGIQLSSMTHQENTPWYETWHNRGGKDHKGTLIDNMLIRDHYCNLSKSREGVAESAASNKA